MELRSGKRTQNHHQQQQLDPFQKLPEDVIISIVSILPFKNAVATSLLSKPWRHRWRKRSITELHLVDIFKELKGDTVDKYVEVVDHVLGSHAGSNLEKFSICTTLPYRYESNVVNWIRFAVEKRASDITIDIRCYTEHYQQRHRDFVIPAWFEKDCSSFLERLTLKRVSLECLSFSQFRSLKSLTLSDWCISQKMVDCILSCCLSLQYFDIRELGGGAVTIKIKTVPNLKHLGVSARGYVEIDVENAPVLESVECGLNLKKPHRFQTVYNKLRKFSIVGANSDAISLLKYVTGRLALDVPNLEILKMRIVSDGLKAHRYKTPGKLSPFNMLRCLIINDWMGETKHLLGVVTILLRMMPLLQSLELSQWYEHGISKSKEMKWTKMKRCIHKHLKFVKTDNFVYDQQGVSLVIFFLQNAINLEHMEIKRQRRKTVWYSDWVVDIDTCDLSPETIEKWFTENGSFNAKLKIY